MVFLRGLFCAESGQNPAESPETKTCVQNQRNPGKNFSFLCGETAQRAQTPPLPRSLPCCRAWQAGIAPELREALKKAKEALDSIWAAAGDALLSGKGIELAYGQAVARECRAATDAIEAALAERGYRTITWDNRGQHESPHSELEDAYTIASLARDAHELAEVFGIHEPHLFGHSFGGLVAQRLGDQLGPTVGLERFGPGVLPDGIAGRDPEDRARSADRNDAGRVQHQRTDGAAERRHG